MLKNFEVFNKTQIILSKFDSSPYEFYLTGSRFFSPGRDSRDSDWDLMVADGEGVYNFLVSLGFNLCRDVGDCESIQTYGDSSIVSVMKHTLEPIHIQIIHSDWMAVKLAAQQMLYSFAILKGVGKAERKMIWNRAMAWMKQNHKDFYNSGSFTESLGELVG